MRKFFWILSGIVFLCIGLRAYSALFFSIKNHDCITGDLLSDTQKNFISEYISHNADTHNSLQDFIIDIKKEFSFIKRIEIRLRPSGALITIDPYEPICFVNDLFVLASNNEFVPKHSFSSKTIETIPAVSIDMGAIDHCPQFLMNIFDVLPSNFNNFYNLDCIKEHCIRLVDKNNPHYVVLFNAEQRDYQRLFEQCEFIKRSLNDRGAFGRGREWVADTRFAHYIIVYQT